jgi:hypothetical protein
MMLTCSGSRMMTSSQTTPRCDGVYRRSARSTQSDELRRPELTYFGIVDVVNLVEDNKLDISDQIGALVQHAS